MILVKEAGYSLEEIQGREAVRTASRPPTLLETLDEVDLTWPGRIALASTLAVLVAGGGALLGLATFALVWTGLAAARVRDADAEPRVEREKVSSPGMQEAEVWRRLVALDELIEMRNDEAEKEQKQAQREQGSLPGV